MLCAKTSRNTYFGFPLNALETRQGWLVALLFLLWRLRVGRWRCSATIPIVVQVRDAKPGAVSAAIPDTLGPLMAVAVGCRISVRTVEVAVGYAIIVGMRLVHNVAAIMDRGATCIRKVLV